VPIPIGCAKSARRPAFRAISSPTAASWRRSGSRTRKRSGSPPALPRPRCWSKTSSTRCEGLARSKSRLSQAARSILSSGSPVNWRRAETFTRRPEAAKQAAKQEDRKTERMRVPFFKEMHIGAYIFKQKLLGRRRYPLVLMLEPLFRCNLACVGCGKIDYPDPILNRRLSVKECLDAVDECGAPMVAIPGGEPLIHREIGEIVKGLVAKKKFVSLC